MESQVLKRKVNEPRENKNEEIVIRQTIDAPKDLVWKAWTEPEFVLAWWGPKYFTAPVIQIDLREGGEYWYCMRSPDGQESWSKGKFVEISEPDRIIMTDSFADAEGNTVPATYYGMSAEFPLEVQVLITFEEEDGKTMLSLHYPGIEGISDTDLRNMEDGWHTSLNKLETVVKNQVRINQKDRTIRMERVFDAPRERVFESMTDPDLVPRWWGPSRLTTTIDQGDVSPGGAWRFVQYDAEGNEYGFHGQYRDVVPPDYVERTFEFEGMPGHVLIETATFEDVGGKTKVTMTNAYDTLEDLNGMFQTGMLDGSTESMDRFSALLEDLQAE
jgi:uncharacterized protein YndB with AHSA1/START domain